MSSVDRFLACTQTTFPHKLMQLQGLLRRLGVLHPGRRGTCARALERPPTWRDGCGQPASGRSVPATSSGRGRQAAAVFARTGGGAGVGGTLVRVVAVVRRDKQASKNGYWIYFS